MNINEHFLISNKITNYVLLEQSIFSIETSNGPKFCRAITQKFLDINQVLGIFKKYKVVFVRERENYNLEEIPTDLYMRYFATNDCISHSYIGETLKHLWCKNLRRKEYIFFHETNL